MIDVYTETVKNGTSEISYTLSYDTDKPKCWLDGHEYQFNKQYLDIQVKHKFRPEKNNEPKSQTKT